MENQAFEEEQHPMVEEAATFSRRSSTHDSQAHPFRTPKIDLLPDVSASNSDGHVYEDILPSVEDVPKSPNLSLSQDPSTNLQRHLEIVDCVSREVSIVSSEPDEVRSTFRRNLTLPFRRAPGPDPSTTSSSVRVTNREKSSCQEDEAEVEARKSIDAAFSSREIEARTQSAALQAECRPNRRRRKKDCKHCRSKATALANARPCDTADDKESEEVLRKNRDNERHRLYSLAPSGPRTILDPCNLGMPPPRSPVAEKFAGRGGDSSTVFTISEKVAGSPMNTLKLIEYERNDAAGVVRPIETNDGKALITPEKNRAGMRVNSIYSQDRWYAKEPSIFLTDVKEHGSFQRAYSLPTRTQTPSSQNRVNLRRSVRGEPPPHPARLHKHRHGWTLHLARPLEGHRCTKSLVFLFILVLALLGIGALALYVVFEPEKLQIIQQYLRSSPASNSSDESALSAGIFSRVKNSERNGTSITTTSTTTPMSSTPNVLLRADQSFPETDTSVSVTAPEAETDATSPSNLNSTRYCDDCLASEVCVALADEEVPICRIALDREDPTGCAGFCLINKQKCHRLDVDAFRCVEVEHYCLDDEWTCSNTLCIPMEKHCDGHMNCYDHSDEYNCVCDLETHFQCGNETSCLPLERRCDGKIDCWDAADEINCTLGRNLGWSCPSDNEFTCSNGQCILKARFCDGLPDCLDGSDEPHGCQGRCNKHEFTCQNSRCIAKGMKCNGIDDCGDGTDERHCKDRLP